MYPRRADLSALEGLEHFPEEIPTVEALPAPIETAANDHQILLRQDDDVLAPIPRCGERRRRNVRARRGDQPEMAAVGVIDGGGRRCRGAG